MKFRVKQLDEKVFIPQFRKYIVSSWNGIDRNGGKIIDWYTEECQLSYCSHETLESAKETIEKYKKLLGIRKGYPKYHKV